MNKGLKASAAASGPREALLKRNTDLMNKGLKVFQNLAGWQIVFFLKETLT